MIKVSYNNNIIDYPSNMIEGHVGQFHYGELNGRAVLYALGRFHYYQGYSMGEVVYPVAIGHYLGVKRLIVTNNSGSLDMSYRINDIMIINDHIGLPTLQTSPLAIYVKRKLSPFVDRTTAYNKRLLYMY